MAHLAFGDKTLIYALGGFILGYILNNQLQTALIGALIGFILSRVT